MTTYYADFDLATGNNDGSDASNAWKTIADVIAGSNGTPPAAGDTVLCKGTDTLSSGPTWNLSGSAASGRIRLVGVDASWANVGGSTRAIIDANSGSFNALYFDGADYVTFENFEFKNAGGSYAGIDTNAAYAEYSIFINCVASGNGGGGFDCGNGYMRFAMFFKCRATGNTGSGFNDMRYCSMAFCRSDNNGGNGFDGYNSRFFGCIAHDNSSDGFYSLIDYCIISCVSVGNTGDAFDIADEPLIVGLRATGNAVGLACPTANRPAIFYYYGDNTTETSGYYDEVLNDGASTITLNGTDTDEGFVDTATDDYNLASGATYRRTAVGIP